MGLTERRAAGAAAAARRREELWAEARRLAAAARAAGAARVIVFGSLARDEVRPASDLDLAVIWDTRLPYGDRLAAMARILRPREGVDLVVLTPDELAERAGFTLIRRILREGVEL